MIPISMLILSVLPFEIKHYTDQVETSPNTTAMTMMVVDVPEGGTSVNQYQL